MRQGNLPTFKPWWFSQDGPILFDVAVRTPREVARVSKNQPRAKSSNSAPKAPGRKARSTGPGRRNLRVVELLRQWQRDDPEEQRETWQYLKKVLDEDRLSERKLFPGT